MSSNSFETLRTEHIDNLDVMCYVSLLGFIINHMIDSPKLVETIIITIPVSIKIRVCENPNSHDLNLAPETENIDHISSSIKTTLSSL